MSEIVLTSLTLLAPTMPVGPSNSCPFPAPHARELLSPHPAPLSRSSSLFRLPQPDYFSIYDHVVPVNPGM